MKTTQQLETWFEAEMPQLVEKLLPGTKPEWGTMTATRMLDHLNDTFKLCTGIYPFPEGSILEKADKYKTISLLSDRPLPRDFTNPLLLLLNKPDDVEHEKAKTDLKEGYRLFKEYYSGKGDQHTMPHNMFGYLNYHEWLWFHYKHFCHHFAQFGLIPYVEKFGLE